MTPANLIATSWELVGTNRRGRPRQSNLRRAVSTAYYAMFHCLAACCADTLVGGAGADRSEPAWRQAYRALEHGTARERCRRTPIVQRFPSDIRQFAYKFVDMQQKRHQADYDPEVDFSKDVVILDIGATNEIIRNFQRVPVKDRRAFAVYVLLSVRSF